MTMFRVVGLTARNDFAELHSKLVKNRDLMNSFEESPDGFLNRLKGSLLLKTSSGYDVDVCDIVATAPLGTRFLTLDYCFSAIMAEGDNPEIDPRVVLAGANVVAIYNAGVMGNAIAYHDVFLGVELAIGAVATKVASTWGAYDRPLEGVKISQKFANVELSPQYLESDLHAFLKSSGVGLTREKMLIQSAFSCGSLARDEDKMSASYSYRDTNFEVLAILDNSLNQLTVSNGLLG